jgi:parallel beta-helix repeat protein
MRLILLLIISFFLVTPGYATTIASKTVWQGKKTITEKVRVEPDAHLVIESGSSIVFEGGSLEVAGRLTARDVKFSGKKWSGIVLKGCGLDTLVAGSEVSGAKIGIQVIGGEPRLEEMTFTGNDVGVELRQHELRQQSEATVAGSIFRENSKVGLFVKDGAAAAILNNRFEKNGRYGAYIFRSTPRRFSGNVFSYHDTALMVAYSGSNPELVDNCFDHNKTAIRVEKAARPHITGSDISNNETGISLYRRADPLIENNLLGQNGIAIAIAFSSYPKISNNDFVDNKKAIYLEFQSSEWEQSKGAAARQAESSRSAFGSLEKSSTELAPPRNLDGTVDARQNWWGAAANRELEKIGADGNPGFIDDGRDRPTFIEEGKEYPLDRVDFSSWRKAALFGGKTN